MLEVADIVRLHGAAFRARFGDSLLPSHKRALNDIQDCRTARFGGHVKQCDHCGGEIYAYHSCRNRHCPKCHGDQTRRWLATQGGRMLPCSFYLVTFTLPAELRALAFANQRKVYGMLMRCAAAALQKLADDPRWLGARLGCLAVLHTWTRALLYHPHVHLLVTAGGLPADGSRWLRPKKSRFPGSGPGSVACLPRQTSRCPQAGGTAPTSSGQGLAKERGASRTGRIFKIQNRS